MGRFNAYYEQLKAKMAGNPKKTLQEAIAELKIESAPPKANARERRNEEDQKRFDYSQKCSNVLIDCAGEAIQKELVLNSTLKRVGAIIGQPDFTVTSGTGGWLNRLLKTDGSPESDAYNDKLVVLMALCTGSINKTKALTVCNYYVGEGVDDYKIYRGDVNNAPETLLNLLDEAIQKGKEQAGKLEESRDLILSGEADEQALGQAYRAIESDEIYLLQNAQSCLNDFKGFSNTLPPAYPNKLPEAEIAKREKEWPLPNKANTQTLIDKAEQAAELPQKLTKAGRYLLKNQALNEHLARYGLSSQEKFLANDEAGCISFLKDPFLRESSTIILKVDEVATAYSHRIEIRDDLPGRLVNFNLKEIKSAVKTKCKYLEDAPHSNEYLDLNEKAQALQDLELDDNPTLAQAKEAAALIWRFSKSLDKFVKSKEGKPAPVNDADYYQRSIKELNKIALDKTSAIDLVCEHIATKAKFELGGQEIEDALNQAAEQPKRNPSGVGKADIYLDVAIAWSAKFAAMEEKWEADYADALRDELNNEKKIQTEVNNHVMENLPSQGMKVWFNLLEESNLQKDVMDRSELKLLLGQDLYQQGLDGTSLSPAELADTMGKNALACRVAQAIMENEENICGKGNHPVKDLVDNGGLYDVVKMVKNSQSFAENYQGLDLSSGSGAALANIMAGKPVNGEGKEVPENEAVVAVKPEKVAEDILKSYLARQRQAAKEGQRKQPAAKAEPVAGMKAANPPAVGK